MSSTQPKPIHWIGGILFDRNRKIILVKNNQGTWSLPGGTPNEGEKVLNTMLREFLEETGTKIFAWQIKKQLEWTGTAKDLGFLVKEENRPKVYNIFFGKNTIDNFVPQKIITDPDIVEVASFDLTYVFRHMLESRYPSEHTKFHSAHALIIKKLKNKITNFEAQAKKAA